MHPAQDNIASDPDKTLHVYTRVSTTTQEDLGTSLATQMELGRTRALSLGFEFRLWNEGAKSSNHEDIVQRPVLSALVDEVERGFVKHIYVQDDSRLSRVDQAASFLRTRFRKHGVKLYTKDGTYDLDNPTDNLTKSLLDAVAQYDNAIRNNRFRQGRLQRVRQGNWHGGPPPFGYILKDKKLVVDADEADAVRSIFEKFAAGQSINAIRLQLIASGVAPRRGGMWNNGSISALLGNTHYIGRYTYRDKAVDETIEVGCPAIVASALWSSVVERIKANALRSSQRNRTTRFYLLRDLMYCGHCGRPIAARTNDKKGEHFYYCPNKERGWKTSSRPTKKHSKKANCGFARSMNIDKADQLIWKTVLELHEKSSLLKEEVKQHLVGDIVRPDGGYNVARQRAEANIKKLKRDVADVLDAMDTLDVDRRLGRLDEDTFLRRDHRLREYRQLLEGQLDLEQNGLVNREADRRWIDWVKAFGTQIEAQKSYTDDERKKYLEGMISRIDVRFLSDTKEHELVLEFVKPIVGDGLDTSQKPYVPIAGTFLKTLKLEGRRRQKRSTPVGIYSVTVE